MISFPLLQCAAASSQAPFIASLSKSESIERRKHDNYRSCCRKSLNPAAPIDTNKIKDLPFVSKVHFYSCFSLISIRIHLIFEDFHRFSKAFCCFDLCRAVFSRDFSEQGLSSRRAGGMRHLGQPRRKGHAATALLAAKAELRN